MQKSLTSSQGFYLKKKYTTRNHKSVSIRNNSKTSYGNRLSTKTQIRNNSSVYISQNRAVDEIVNKSQVEILSRVINTANNSQGRSLSKSAHRYKMLNFSGHRQSKYLNAGGNPLQDFRRKNQREFMMGKVRSNVNLYTFLNKAQQLETQYVNFNAQEDYEKAAQIIIQLLNYTVDLNLVYQFSIALKVLADFYIQCGRVKQALLYYNQTKQSALLLNQPILLIQSLIGIAKCCSKGYLQKQGISILKKALEYAWHYDKKQLQLQLYDQIGQKYYHLGDINKAKKYHLRYVNSIYEPSDSAHKSLSRQRIKKNEQLNIQLKYSELSILFLVHLKIPIRSLKQVPPIQDKRTSYLNCQGGSLSIRNEFNINKKYFSHFQDIDSWMRNIMKSWFFAEQMDQPPLSNQDWTTPLKMKKFAYIDFKLNQHLKKFTNKIIPPHNSSIKQVKFKQNLQQKIQRKLKQPPIDSDWYEKMAQQIVRDHKNKLLNVRDAVRMRGYNKSTRPQMQMLKQIYNKFFQMRSD